MVWIRANDDLLTGQQRLPVRCSETGRTGYMDVRLVGGRHQLVPPVYEELGSNTYRLIDAEPRLAAYR